MAQSAEQYRLNTYMYIEIMNVVLSEKTCSSILDFLHRLNNRIRDTHGKGITII